MRIRCSTVTVVTVAVAPSPRLGLTRLVLRLDTSKAQSCLPAQRGR